MKTKLIFFIVALAFLGSNQTFGQNAPKKAEFEYLVITFGKTTFSNVAVTVGSGQSKLGGFIEINDILEGRESVPLQRRLDILGRFGWELVGIVGQIGGDQQILLKRERRPFNVAEQKAMKELAGKLRKEAEEQMKDMERQRKAAAEAAARAPRPEELIELDAKEKRQREVAARDAALKKFKTLFPVKGKGFYTSPTTVIGVSSSISANERYDSRKTQINGRVSVNIDCTDLLIEGGNGYRASMAKKLAKDATQVLIEELGLSDDYVRDYIYSFDVSVVISIRWNGKFVQITTDSDTAYGR